MKKFKVHQERMSSKEKKFLNSHFVLPEEYTQELFLWAECWPEKGNPCFELKLGNEHFEMYLEVGSEFYDMLLPFLGFYES